MILTATVRRTIRSAPVRHQLARAGLWHHRPREIPLDRLLMGGQNQASASAFADATGDLLWGSRRVVEGPHADLLRRTGRIDAATVLASPYGQMARACIDLTGSYFAARDDAGIVAEATRFVERDRSGPGLVPEGDGHSPPGQPVLVVPVADSDFYQVVDGHHRVALMAREGARTVTARVRRGSTLTPLQERLRAMSWLEGRPRLYQPVSAPELASWTLVRKCTDRLEKMTRFLADLPEMTGVRAEPRRYLDVASCYGWFVDQMSAAGYDAEGIERDPLAPGLGEAVYGLDPSRIRVGDAEEALAAVTRRYDVVSCFSLLHHFVLGRGRCTPEELVRRLDDVTEQVLFIDTGQEHEQWFQRSLHGWSADHIRSFLCRNTSFDAVIDLGPDDDAVPPYADNYGRHLFACVRTG